MPDYRDDLTIVDSDDLLRRVPINPMHVVWDGNEQRHRPSSAAFENDRDGEPMSVALLSVLRQNHLPPESVLAGLPLFALAAITAKIARENRQGIARAPRPNDPAHAVVFGEKPKSVAEEACERCTMDRRAADRRTVNE